MTEKESRLESSEQLPVAKNLDCLTPVPFRHDFCNETDLITSLSPNRDYNLSLPPSRRPEMGAEELLIEFYGENMTPIFDSIYEMTKTGFDVELRRDWYSGIILDQDFVFFPPTPLIHQKEQLNEFVRKLTHDRISFPKLSKREWHRKWVYGYTQKRLGMLEDAGARIIPVNVPKKLTEKIRVDRGRDHYKIVYIKDPNRMVSWFGGMNLAEIHFRLLDFMIKFDDPRIVQAFIDEFHRIGENERTENAKIQVTEDTELLIDTGKGKSLIIEEAIKEIDSAEKTIYASSAFRPSGEILDALVRAENREVHVAWITSNLHFLRSLFAEQGLLSPELLVWLKATASDFVSGRKGKIPVMFPENAGVHAKAMVFDEKTVIFGAHNFDNSRNKELSLRSTTPILVKNIVEGYFREVAGEYLDRELDSDFIIPAIDKQ